MSFLWKSGVVVRKMKSKKGFTLLELILVLGVGSAISFMKFQEIKNEQENAVANGVGYQMKQVGEAVNRYISIRYDKLATLSSAVGNGTDPGPRTCSTVGCEITYQTLINEGLLPSTYTGINIQKSGYKIFLRRDGASPDYVINGLVTTTRSWSEGVKIRYDLLGLAMQAAGVDSGVTRTNTNAFGYGGQWTENSSNYTGINAEGLLAYRVGYDSALYSVYLRRDGSLPMTGDLNMGGNSINNAKDVTASGTGTFGGNLALNGLSPTDFPTGWKGGLRTNNVMAGGTVGAGTSSSVNAYINNLGEVYGSKTVTSGGDLIAHNGYGDQISFGGDAVANDFDIKLSGKDYLGFLSADRVPITVGVNGKILVRPPSSDSSNPNKITLDSSDGSISTTGRFATQGLNPNEMPPGFGAGGIRTIDVITTGSFYTIQSGTNIADGKFAFYARQDGIVQASGNILAGGMVRADNFQPTSTAVVGGACNYSGAISRDAAGFTLSCQSNKWQRQFNPTITMRDDGVWASNSDFQACNSDEVIVGGGGQCEDPAHHFIHFSGPSNNGWSVDCFYTDPQYKDLGTRTYALCMKK